MQLGSGCTRFRQIGHKYLNKSIFVDCPLESVSCRPLSLPWSLIIHFLPFLFIPFGSGQYCDGEIEPFVSSRLRASSLALLLFDHQRRPAENDRRNEHLTSSNGTFSKRIYMGSFSGKSVIFFALYSLNYCASKIDTGRFQWSRGSVEELSISIIKEKMGYLHIGV